LKRIRRPGAPGREPQGLLNTDAQRQEAQRLLAIRSWHREWSQAIFGEGTALGFNSSVSSGFETLAAP
jgi:hypothetical protein